MKNQDSRNAQAAPPKALFHETEPPFSNNGLFSDHYLMKRLPDEPIWSDGKWSDDKWESLHEKLKALLDKYTRESQPDNEEDTRSQWLDKVLELLGFEKHRESGEQGGTPDYILYAGQEDKESASESLKKSRANTRYPFALTILEAKHWGRALDKRAADHGPMFDRENPVMQVNRYLNNAHTLSNNRIQWAILTNGQLWRLYWYGSQSRMFTHFELDLIDLIRHPHKVTKDEDWARFRFFPLMFSKKSFEWVFDGKCVLDRLRESSIDHAVGVAESLDKAIYGEDGVYIRLARGLYESAIGKSQKGIAASALKDVKTLETYTLTLLYRLLFLLFAEDRNLLPMDQRGYQEMSLASIRKNVADAVRDSTPFGRSTKYWGQLMELFDLVESGDPELDLPYYNGGLFDKAKHPLFRDLAILDRDLVPALDAISRVPQGIHRLMVDYKDLGVRQLGSLYERLLEYPLVESEGTVQLSQDSIERKKSGSYYTNEDLVAALVEKTLEPVLQDKKQAVREMLSRRLPAERPEQTDAPQDPTLALSDEVTDTLLDIKVLDPAMGSGHFLTASLNYLTERIMEIVADHDDDPDIGPRMAVHPLSKMLAAQQDEILDSLKAQGIAGKTREKVAKRLSEANMLKRALMKRCIFGVDINPMAVELAKLSLWLDSFTLGAPLTFLDHHLKCGNSLVGATTEDHEALLRNQRESGTRQGSLFAEETGEGRRAIMQKLKDMAHLTDATHDQIEYTADLHRDIEGGLKRGKLALDVVASASFSNGRDPQKLKAVGTLLADQGAMQAMLELVDKDAKTTGQLPGPIGECARNVLVDRANHSFFHWQLEFPDVLLGGGNGAEREDPGFDAILANPPWERIKIMQNEWFDKRMPSVVRLQTEAKRKRTISELAKKDPELWNEYQRDRQICQEMLDYCHGSGSPYPLLGKGDTNLYGLIVERSLGLLKKNGRAGFVVPSGICMDKGSSEFFGKMVEGRRLCFMYDFENRHKQFPGVDSRFKFCLIGFSGANGNGSNIPAAFFLHDTKEMQTQAITLEKRDFELMNPNTKTCPVFRSKDDYRITKRIYGRVPILHRHEPDENPWGLTYKTLFHMTNDSGLFMTAKELGKLGAWPEDGGLPSYNSPKGRFLPLLEGKMVNQWNPRWAGVKINLENIHHKAAPDASAIGDLTDPGYFPTPQFWVSESELLKRLPSREPWLLVFRDITNATNSRTLIAAPVPFCALGNKLPTLLFPHDISQNLRLCFLAESSSLVKDYVTRKKIKETLNLFIVEQLPALPPAFYSSTFHGQTWESLIAPRAFELSYTCDALKPMADAYGHEGRPFEWDEGRRRALRAQLDALFLLAYGFDSQEDEPDVAHILGSFPILQKEQPGYAGLVTNYVRAYRAGSLDAKVKAE